MIFRLSGDDGVGSLKRPTCSLRRKIETQHIRRLVSGSSLLYQGDEHVSDAPTKPRAFFDLFAGSMDGQATWNDVDDFIDAWHDSGDDKQRPLHEFLGMTEEEYAIWMMDRRTLPELALARRPGGPMIESLITDRVRRMRAGNDPLDRTALFSLDHRLKACGIDA
jgi:hypothetical protein